LLASGAIERPLVFGGNDRPGVMMASAVSAYLNRFAALPGKRAVVFTTTDSGWRTAEDLIDAGVEVAAVVDARPVAPPISPLLRQAGVPLLLDAVVRRAGGAPLRAVEVQSQDGATRRFAADLLAVSGGWNPAIALTGALGARPAWSDRLHCFLADMTPPGMQVIGAAAGRYAVADALADGVRCAAEIVVALGLAANMPALPKVESEPIGAAPLWRAGNAKDKAFVDFQHDVTDQDIALARREGFVSVEHLKRYTTLGMATDQGRTSQVNGIALLAAATGSGIAETGTILSRPPIQPISIGVLAGQQRGAQFRPQRHTASHLWATEQGASFADAGLWKRARWFSRPDEANWLQTVNREVVAVRNAAGFCDVSTLGKIDLFGVDAGLLLDRLYINSISTLAVGKVRYGVMLREDGFVMDDGTITRFGQEHFYITTTTLNAAKVMQHIDYARQVLWPELDTQAVSVTEQWATTAVAGPLSRALLQRLLPDLDLSAQAFPLMAAMRFAWHGTPSRLSRVSFSGELAYEISVPAHHGDRLVRAIAETGQAFGAVPYGTEALGVLRIEKGHPAGNELNGQTTAGDLGMARLMSNKKDYIGRVMATRPALTDEDRPSLVGLRPLDAKARLRAGAHLLPAGKPVLAAHDEGHVTSVAFSPTLGHWIGLGLLRRGRLRHGERILMHDPVRKGDAEVSVCSPVFVDPDGGRLRV
jgi:sarcosine oxidase subunit alpha